MKKTMTKKEQFYYIFMLFTIMLVLAISFSFRGLFIPTFKTTFNVSDKSIGIFLAISQLTAMFSYFIGSKLLNKIGQKYIICLGLLICSITFYLISYSTVFIHLIIGYVFITFGTSSMILGINTSITLLQVSFQALLMNLIHGFFGIGNTMSQKTIGILLTNNITWQQIYRTMGVIFFAVFIIFSFAYNLKQKKKSKDDATIQNKKLLFLFIMAIGFYVSAEIQTGNWFMNLLKSEYTLDAKTATTFTSVFFASFTIGRLLGGFISERKGYFNSIIASVFLSIITYTVGLLLKAHGLYFIALSGLFLSLVYPTSIVIVGKIFDKNKSEAISWISITSSIFVLATGLLIGFLNDLIGPYLSFYLIPLFNTISLVFYLYIKRNLKKLNI